ncbi:MAG: ubiquinol-cytochrome c reductase iron-sulfur subunit [Pyrinomonadaceae bacterium]
MSEDLTKAISKVLSDEKDVERSTAVYEKDFPHNRDSEGQVTRREFCSFLFLTSTTLLAGSVGFAAKAAYDANNKPVFPSALIEGSTQLQPGNSLNFKYPGENDSAILIRAANGNYYAYGQKCTHLSCPVYYAKEDDRLECPCHEGAFAVDSGEVLYGPPPRPLDQIEIEVGENGEIWAKGRKQIGVEDERNG